MSSDWTFLNDTTPKAKKAYKCYLCNLPIAIGEKHVARAGVCDFRAFTTRMHEKCVAMTKNWQEDDWLYFEPKEFRRHELGLPDQPACGVDKSKPTGCDGTSVLSHSENQNATAS